MSTFSKFLKIPLTFILGVALGSSGTLVVCSIFMVQTRTDQVLEDIPGQVQQSITSTRKPDHERERWASQLADTFEVSGHFHRYTRQLIVIESMNDKLVFELIEHLGTSDFNLANEKRRELLSVLIGKATKIDPVSTLVATSSIDPRFFDIALTSLFRVWVREDLTQALVEVSNLDERVLYRGPRPYVKTSELSPVEQNAFRSRLGFDKLAMDSFFKTIEGEPNYDYNDVWNEVLSLVEAGKVDPMHDLVVRVAEEWILSSGLSDPATIHEQIRQLNTGQVVMGIVLEVVAKLLPRETFLHLIANNRDRTLPIRNLAFRNWMNLAPSEAYKTVLTYPTQTQHTLLLDGLQRPNSKAKEWTLYEQRTRDIGTTSPLETLASSQPRLALQWIELESVDIHQRWEMEYSVLDELVLVNPELAISTASTFTHFQERSLYKIVDTLLLHDLDVAIKLLPKFNQSNRAVIHARIAREVLLRGDSHKAFDFGKRLLETGGAKNVDAKVFNLLIVREWYKHDNNGFVNTIDTLDVAEKERSYLIREALINAHRIVPPTQTDLKRLMPLMNADDIKKIENASWFKSLTDFR